MANLIVTLKTSLAAARIRVWAERVAPPSSSGKVNVTSWRIGRKDQGGSCLL